MGQTRAAIGVFVLLAGLLGTGSHAVAQDLASLPRDHPEVTVVTTAGETTVGVLRRFDASSITLDLDGQDRVFQKPSIARVYQDDSLKNGMLRGLAAGLAVAVVATATQCHEFSSPSRPCSHEDGFFVFALLAPVFGGAGLGIGAAVDALVHRRNLLFEGARDGAPAASPVTLHLDRGAARLAVRIRW